MKRLFEIDVPDRLGVKLTGQTLRGLICQRFGGCQDIQVRAVRPGIPGLDSQIEAIAEAVARKVDKPY